MPKAGQVIRTNDVHRVVGFEPITANTADIGTTETVVLTVPSVTFENDRAYEVRLSTLVNGSTATSRARIGFRKNNISGATYITLQDLVPPAAGANLPIDIGRILVNTSGADVTMDLAVTLDEQAASGTVRFSASATSSAGFVMITDIGEATAYAGMNTVS